MPKRVLILVIIILLLGNFNLVFANDEIGKIKEAIVTTKDKAELGQLYMKLGNYYVSNNKLQEAADAYIQALSLARETFTAEERIKIAIHLSWAGKFGESIEELRRVLSENPKNLTAQINLARTLSWSGELDKAIEEADKVLKESPENKDALLIKANVLSWKRNLRAAIPLYKKILEKEEDFDARLGFTYALLWGGKRKEARSNVQLLHPQYPYQENELQKLRDAINNATQPNVEIRYSYFKDSDDNRLNRYSLGYGFWADNWKVDLKYRHTEADDDIRDEKSEELSLNAYSRFTEYFGIGGGIGVNNSGRGDSSTFPTGNMRADVTVFNATIGANIVRDVLTDTAELIDNGIIITNTGFYITRDLNSRISLYGGYNYKDYSDGNSANDWQSSVRCLVYSKPSVSIGYRFRYLNYSRQSRGGYFDPEDFISHQLFGSVYFEKGRLYGSFEPYFGYESFERYNNLENDFFAGGSGLLGYKIKERVSLEINGEGGNYAVESTAGYTYYLAGLRILYFF